VSTRHVRVAASPDADDRFMVWALATGRLATPGYTWSFEHHPTDVLNTLGDRADLDVLALSMAAWPGLAGRWRILPHGGSMGEGYGPVVVATTPRSLSSLSGRPVAIPGETTTAWSVLRMLVDAVPVHTPITPYALAFDRLRAGEVDAALLIHEGRLTWQAEGFHAVVELGQAWREIAGERPLPLGINAIRASLAPADQAAISRHLRDAIAYGLAHREDAIAWLLDHGSSLREAGQLRTYLDMYANARTLDYGDAGRDAVSFYLQKGSEVGLWAAVAADWAP
jgi:1,4-dihydroxy-6-naphthoate synthase